MLPTDFEILGTIPGELEHHLIWLLGSLERNSEHPLAKAVVSYSESRLNRGYLETHPFVHPSDFQAMTGRGASGTILGKTSVAIGNRAFALIKGLMIPAQAEEKMRDLEYQGKTAILAGVDGVVCIVLGVADEVKPDAAASISHLRDVMKIDVWMVTGDNDCTAKAISRQLGIPSNRVISEALPAEKVQHVRDLQATGKLVAMVGDGINDSPPRQPCPSASRCWYKHRYWRQNCC